MYDYVSGWWLVCRVKRFKSHTSRPMMVCLTYRTPGWSKTERLLRTQVLTTTWPALSLPDPQDGGIFARQKYPHERKLEQREVPI